MIRYLLVVVKTNEMREGGGGEESRILLGMGHQIGGKYAIFKQQGHLVTL